MKMRREAAHPRPALPLVNLLSPASLDLIAVRRLRRRFLWGGLAVAMLVAGLWATQHLRVGEAEKVVAIEQAETARLNSESRALIPVRAYVAGVEAQKATVQSAMEREIYVSEVLDGIRDSSPAGATLDVLSVTLAPAPVTQEGTEPVDAVTPCPGPDPFNTKTVVACVTLSGTAVNRADVGRFVIALGAVDIFVEPFISTTTTADSEGVSFSGSVGLSDEIFTGRYVDMFAEGEER